jgi:hypothetical protein
MSKTQELAAAFLQKAQAMRPVPMRTNSINAFNALFAVQELSEQESRAIEKILVEGYEPGAFSEDGVDADAFEIKRLTKELRAIKRQEMVLIGERIAQARDVFKKYQKRSFREWMDFTFGSFKTGYNYLAFFDLYSAMPIELREPLKEMPAKAVYVLASRKAPIEQKIELVRNSRSEERAEDLIALIRSTLDGVTELRVPSATRIVSALEKTASLLLPNRIDVLQRNRLILLVEYLKDVIERSKS